MKYRHLSLHRAWPLAVATAASLAGFGCGGSAKTAESTTAAATPAARAPAPAAPRPTACALVSAEEMSAIVGSTVAVETSESSGGLCRYKAATSALPLIDLEVAWGDGEVGMMSAGMLGRLEPEMAAALDGVGDQASKIGPRLMVRTGDDLVTLTMLGVDDLVQSARRVLELVRPRMGATSRSSAERAPQDGEPSGARSDEAAAVAQVVGQLAGGLLGALEDRGTPPVDAAAPASPGTAPKTTLDSIVEEPEFAPAAGNAPRIPLVAGLQLVLARYEPGQGDYEPIVTVAAATAASVSMDYSTDLPDGSRLKVRRVVRQDDLARAHAWRATFGNLDPETFAGTTAFSLSADVLTSLKQKGETELTQHVPPNSPLAAAASLLGGLGGGPNADDKQRTVVRRVQPSAVGVPVVVNGAAVSLPAIQLRGVFGGETLDLWVLDDAANPLLLRSRGNRGSAARMVRIAFPVAAASTAVEERLRAESRVAVHGIYFDFNKATLKPESEPVLREIAAALTHNPGWRVEIEGHTDNIGGERFNEELSRRRADAVRQALIDRYGLPAKTLSASGLGASRPKASNDTLIGRAQNRRVELVRRAS